MPRLIDTTYNKCVHSLIEPYSQRLFERSDMKTVEFLQQVIRSCERNQFFTIKAESFRVIDNVQEINQTLRSIEESTGNKRVAINKYDYINLNESEVFLLEINYYLEINGQSERFPVYIQVPRIVDKYYIKVDGVTYSAMFQIVDGSTFNNTGAKGNKKTPVVQFKSLFRPYINYRFKAELNTVNDGTIAAADFESAVINEKQRYMTPLYFIARFGLYGAMRYLGLSGIDITSFPDNRESHYCFPVSNDCYISCPKVMYDSNHVMQSFVYTMAMYGVNEDRPMEALKDQRFWLSKMVYPYKTGSKLPPNFNLDVEAQKGAVILDSFEHMYDISTMNAIHLPYEDKCNIYAILRWIMYEFKALRLKSNTDISTKRIRFEEYIAAIYANRLASSLIQRTSTLKGLNLKKLKQAVSIKHDWIVKNINSENLIAYNDAVNDNDLLYGTKYTYKGISGIGTKKTSAVPVEYRMIYPSHLGIVDIYSSSNSDPGMTGTMCPYVHINPDGTFTDFMEPNSWRDSLRTVEQQYKNSFHPIRLFPNRQMTETDVIMNIQNQATAAAALNLTQQAMTTEDVPIALEPSGTIQAYYA